MQLNALCIYSLPFFSTFLLTHNPKGQLEKHSHFLLHRESVMAKKDDMVREGK
jgi:hypothetical protein